LNELPKAASTRPAVSPDACQEHDDVPSADPLTTLAGCDQTIIPLSARGAEAESSVARVFNTAQGNGV
jgi:hypothetical protein